MKASTINTSDINSNIPIFVTVNRNGFINCWLNEPIKDEKAGKWVGKFTFADSENYERVKSIVKETGYSWNIDEPLILTLNKKTTK